ncbi:hypothetical protein HUG17_10663 [Dermatophagoides farinae]|uniref:DUF5641 domain-containing protein n=1 Tax=Dermatophagoides farinae TaxID=6954 RepID=A0A9D4NXH2_DERFA|nr:hypothetical protein HUG17_10663 [Dermatophagoides farinae]
MNLKQENNIDDVWEMKIERSKFVKEVAKLWMSQYLKKLARMSTNKSTDVQIGDWLMLPEFLTKRSNWPIGQVMEVKSGSDGNNNNNNDQMISTHSLFPMVCRCFHIDN